MNDEIEYIESNETEYLMVMMGDQAFGIPVLVIQDVLSSQKVTKIPLSIPEIEGSLNLRGRIVTAINMCKYLNIETLNSHDNTKDMSIVVEHNKYLYSLIVDKVGDVLSLPNNKIEKNPVTLDTALKEISSGIYRLEDRLLIVLDVIGFLNSLCKEEVA